MFNEYFKILDIKPTSSINEIRMAFKKQLFLWHPDRAKVNNRKNEELNNKTRKIIEAYNFLKDNIKYETDFEEVIANVEINWDIRQNITSSNLEWIEYYPNLEILIVGFKNSGIYLYENVPKIIHYELISAPSKGKYLNKNIAHSLNYHKLENYAEWYKFAKRIYG